MMLNCIFALAQQDDPIHKEGVDQHEEKFVHDLFQIGEEGLKQQDKGVQQVQQNGKGRCALFAAGARTSVPPEDAPDARMSPIPMPKKMPAKDHTEKGVPCGIAGHSGKQLGQTVKRGGRR